jgi:hypothetical protein
MLVRVRDFGAENTAIFPESTLAGQMFAQVNAAVLQLSQHAATEVTGRGAAREGINTKAIVRGELRKQLETINLTARALAIETLRLDDNFQMPQDRSDQALLSTARSFAQNATPLESAFITHAMPATFLADLNGCISRFEQAMHDHQSGKGTQVAARASINAALTAGFTAVRHLDAIVTNSLRADPVNAAVWERIRHVEQAPHTRGASAKTPATTAATTASPATPAAPTTGTPTTTEVK